MHLRTVAIIILAILSLGLYLLLSLSQSTQPEIGRLLVVSMALAGLYLLMLPLTKGLSLFGSDRQVLIGLAVIAVGIRLLILITAGEGAYLSNNVYRHVWEGGLVAHGYNPYAVIPESFDRSGMAEGELFVGMNAAATEGAAPPLAQLLFAVAYISHSDSVFGFKLLSFFFELLTIIGLVMLLAPTVRRRPYESWAILIWVFSPLVIVEFLLSNHVDIFAIPFLVFAVVWVRRGDAVLSGVLLALAALLKTFALLLVPVLLLHFAGRQRWRFAAGLTATLIVFYLPFLPGAGWNALQSAVFIPQSEPFAGLVYMLAKWIAGPTAALWTCLVLLTVVIVATSTVLKQRLPHIEQRLFVVIGAMMILAPALSPWYLVWVLPFVVLYRETAFLLLSVTALLSYHSLISYYESGEFHREWTMVAMQYMPFFVLIAWKLVRSRLTRPSLAPDKT